MARDGFRILDSDMHIMEPHDLWQRYMNPVFSHRIRGSNRGPMDMGVEVEGRTSRQNENPSSTSNGPTIPGMSSRDAAGKEQNKRYIEANCSWLPWLMWRMDEQQEWTTRYGNPGRDGHQQVDQELEDHMIPGPGDGLIDVQVPLLVGSTVLKEVHDLGSYRWMHVELSQRLVQVLLAASMLFHPVVHEVSHRVSGGVKHIVPPHRILLQQKDGLPLVVVQGPPYFWTHQAQGAPSVNSRQELRRI